MKKQTLKKVLVGVGVVIGIPLSVITIPAVGIRYAFMKRAIRTGKVDGWIQEVNSYIPYEIKDTIPAPAYVEDDKSKMYIRISDQDLMSAAIAPIRFKTAVQAIIAHEVGHVLDEDLDYIQQVIQQHIRNRNYESYRSMVLYREQRAWELGKKVAPNKAYYEKYNKTNMAKYKELMALEKPEWGGR